MSTIGKLYNSKFIAYVNRQLSSFHLDINILRNKHTISHEVESAQSRKTNNYTRYPTKKRFGVILALTNVLGGLKSRLPG